MKKLSCFFIILSLLGSFACKKDSVKVPPKAFEDITHQDIKSLYDKTGFTFQEILISTAQGDVLKPGAVILYRLGNGVLGKLKIVSISVQNVLTIDLVNYDYHTGAVLKDKKGATVQGTCFFDLNTGLQTANLVAYGFSFDIFDSELDRRLLPFFGTRIYVYSK